MKRKFLALILAMLMVLSMLAGCGGGESGGSGDSDGGSSESSGGSGGGSESSGGASDAGSQDVIEAEEVDTSRTTGQAEKMVVALSSDPNDLSPWNVNNGAKAYIYPMFYEFLFNQNPTTGEYIPVIAEGYTVSDDGLYWDVKIREGVYDHNGNAIDAHDVAFSYELQYGGGYMVKMTMFEELEVIDDYTVRFHWNKVIDGVCEVEWPLCRGAIIDQESYEAGNYATAPVGTGPYKVTEFTAGSGLTMVKNEDYWWDKAVGGERPQGHNANVDTIEFVVMTESAQHVIALQNGDIDISYGVPNEYLADFTSAEGLTVSKAPNAMVYCVAHNQTAQFGGDINFRLATYHALDAQALAEASGTYSYTNCIASPRFAEYHEALSKLDDYMDHYDPELAKEYLAKSNYDGETLVFMSDNSEASKNIATMAQALWQAVGINAEIAVLDGTTLNSRLNENDWDLTLTSYGGGTLIGGWNRILNVGDFADGKSLGHNGDSTLHTMYQETALITNMSVETMSALHKYVTDNAYMYAYAHQNSVYVYNTNLIAQMALKPDASTVAWGDFTFYTD